MNSQSELKPWRAVTKDAHLFFIVEANLPYIHPLCFAQVGPKSIHHIHVVHLVTLLIYKALQISAINLESYSGFAISL